VFSAQTASGIIERVYRFHADRYDFEASVRASDAVLAGAQNVAWSFGPGIGPTEASVTDDQMAFKANALLGQEFHRKRPAAFGHDHVEKYSGTLSWATLQTKYFLAALYPDEPTRADIEMTGAKQLHRISETVSVPMKTAGSELKQSMHVYMGPLDYKLLGSIGIGLERNVEMGFKPIRPVSTGVMWAMKKLYHLIPNYGVVVIIISVLTKVLFYRLTHKSFKSMKQLQDLQPQLQAIKEKYGDDRKRLSEETMKLYKEMGVNPLNAPVNVIIAVWPWGAYLGEDALEQGVRIKISSWRRNGQNSLPSAAKATGQYINSVLAKVESLKAGYDEAIMLNEQGFITDGSGENVFIVRGGILTTPPTQAGCLDGITRGSVIQIARDLGYEVREENLVRSDLYNADECFFSGTAAEITPIREVDDRAVGEGHRGPITKELQGAFFAATKGETEKYADWLTHVNHDRIRPGGP
jgi:branched-subunit amino acid aminotransferase/4-amino-4-deoxychorismate lyase